MIKCAKKKMRKRKKNRRKKEEKNRRKKEEKIAKKKKVGHSVQQKPVGFLVTKRGRGENLEKVILRMN